MKSTRPREYLVRIVLAAHEDEVLQCVRETVMVVGLRGCKTGIGGEQAVSNGGGDTPTA